jgi:cell wall-associated NlpC family hydrolase
MAPRAGISGLAVALAGGGALLVYAGLRGESPLESARAVLTGNPPRVPEGHPVTLEGPFGGGDFPPAPGGPFSSLVSAAERYLGVRYRWGGKDPRTGLDCSGLVFVAFRDVGIKAPLSSFTQSHWSQVRRISASQAGPGDLVYWSTVPGHIGIVTGPDKMINAPHTGAVVRFDSISGHSSTVTPLYLRYVGAHGALRQPPALLGTGQP